MNKYRDFNVKEYNKALIKMRLLRGVSDCYVCVFSGIIINLSRN